MKNCVKILAVLCIGVFAGLLVRGIPVVLHVQAGGGIPQADQNGDVNGDQSLDISDAVFILRYLFSGGPEPVAIAQQVPADVQGIEGQLERIANSLDDLAYESSLKRHDRFQDNEDGTVTDTVTNLMISKEAAFITLGERQVRELSVQEAMEFTENLTTAGYSDWRLPTAAELVLIKRGQPNRPWGVEWDTYLITSTQFGLPEDNRYEAVRWVSGDTIARGLPFSRTGFNTDRGQAVSVRDILPGE